MSTTVQRELAQTNRTLGTILLHEVTAGAAVAH